MKKMRACQVLSGIITCGLGLKFGWWVLISVLVLNAINYYMGWKDMNMKSLQLQRLWENYNNYLRKQLVKYMPKKQF